MSLPFGVGREPSNGVDTYGWPANREFYANWKSGSGNSGRYLWDNVTVQRNCTDMNARPVSACVGGSIVAIDCEGAPCCVVEGSGADNPHWPPADLPVTETASSPASITIGYNTYEKLSTFADYAQCQRIGFKNVQARKLWQGSVGFQLAEDCNDPCTRTRPAVKYLTYTKEITGSCPLFFYDRGDGTPGFVPAGYHFKQVIHIDKRGNITSPTCVEEYTFNGAPVDCAKVGDEGDSTFGHEYYGMTPSCGLLGGYFAPDYAPESGEAVSSSVARDSVTGTYSKLITLPGGIYSTTYTFTSTATYTDPYTFADVLDDAKGLLSNFPINDDFIYPWRTDEKVQIAPLVSYREGNGAPPTGLPCKVDPGIPYGGTEPEGDFDLTRDVPCTGGHGWTYGQWWAYDHLMPWNDTGYTVVGGTAVANPPAYDGAVIGKPAPLNAEGQFDFSHRIWTKGCGDDPSVPWVSSLGSRPPEYIPKTATQWTENNPANSYPAGAFVMASIDMVVVQKWAQTLLPLPSYDFARPYGAVDQALIDETTRTCESEGTLRFPDAPTEPAVPEDADTRRKGQYVYATWDFDMRSFSCSTGTLAASLTQHCLPYKPCDPAVVCISPDDEFENGKTFDFGTPTFDMDFGCRWQALPVLGMPDPLWQRPFPPCGTPDTDGFGSDGKLTDAYWRMDDGGCLADGLDYDGSTSAEFRQYYAMPNQYEAILESYRVSAGLPALPSGVTLITEVAAPSPINCYDGVTYFTEWGTYLRRKNCGCNGGTFASYYALAVNCGA